MNLHRAWTRFTLLLWAVLGCSATDSPQEETIARDSAGVRIIENREGAWRVPWVVSDLPTLTIGAIGGNPDQELDIVTGAIGLPGDRIVVANAGRSELLFYDGEGNLLRRVGGRGEGPGEFQSLEWLSRYGADSLLALDVLNHRVSFFDLAGNFGRSVRLEPNPQIPFPRPVGFFSDGSFLATQGTFRLGGDPPARVERTTEPLFRFEADGKTVIHLGSFPGPEWVIAPIGPVNRALERRKRPFGRETAFVAAGDQFFVADNETYEVRAYSVTGQLLRIIRKQATPIALTDSHIRAFQDSVLAAASAMSEPQVRALFENLPPPPPTFPAYAPDIRIDADLNLWVREVAPPGIRRPRWSVFTAEGVFQGVLEMPPGLDVMDIGHDFVLGLERDHLDVEYVRKFELRKD